MNYGRTSYIRNVVYNRKDFYTMLSATVSDSKVSCSNYSGVPELG